MPLSKPQKIISDDGNRFKVVVSGRRFGKSYLAMNEMAKFARFPNKRIYYVAPTYRQAKTIIWDDLKQKISKVRWARKINESDLSITLINGSKIYLRSADAYDSLRGISIDFLVMDECAMIDHKAWTEVLRPALSDREGHALFITTPKGRNWIYDLFVGAQTLEDWTTFSYTTEDGGNVPLKEIEAAKKDLDEKTFRQEYQATFESYSGLIYYNWDAKKHIAEPELVINERTLLHVGFDFNVSPLVAAVAVVSNAGIIHFIDEVVLEGSNTFEMCEELQRRYPSNRIWAYPDASGQARKTSSYTSDHNIMRQAGMTIKAGRSNPAVQDRISSVNANLKSATGDVRVYVSSKCKNIIKCIGNQTYKEGTRVPDKTHGLDHMSDAVGYLIHYINPIKAPIVKTTGSGLFGHF